MVVGRVEVEHRVRAALAPLVDHRLDVGVGRDRERRHVPLLDAEARVAQHAVHVVVAEQRPRPDRAEVHRVLLAHQRVLRVRVVEEAGLERVEHRRQVAGVRGVFARRHVRHAYARPAAGRDVTSVTRGETSCSNPATSVRLPCRDGSRRPGAARGNATARRSSTRCSACYEAGDPAAERARGRGAGRRLGALGAQPLRRRRSAARRGRAAAVGALRAPRSAPVAIDRRARRRSARAFFEAVTPVRRAALLSVHDSPTIARNLARLDRLLRRQLEPLFPDVDDRHARRARARRRAGTRGTACAPRRAAASPRARRVRRTRPFAHSPKGTSDERHPPEQGTVHRAHERARRRSGRDAQPLEVQAAAAARRSTASTATPSCRWSRRAAARCCGWARSTRR